MTEAEKVMAVLTAFPDAKVVECLASTKREAMILAIRRQNAQRPPDTPICRTSTLRSEHEALADEAPEQAPEADELRLAI